MLIASDLDGVIAYTPLKKDDYVPFKLRIFYNSCKPTKYSILDFDYIITGRKEFFRKLTEEWLEKYDVKYDKLVMYPNRVRKSMDGIFKYKAKVINDLGIGKYYENHRGIYNHLMENCRNTEIVFVDGL
jgi:hypothetical protein